MKHMIIALIIASFSLMIMSCNEQKKADKVKLTIQAAESKSSNIEIGTLKMFSFEASTLAETELDSSGMGMIEFCHGGSNATT